MALTINFFNLPDYIMSMNPLIKPKRLILFSILIQVLSLGLTGCSKDENFLPIDGTLNGTILAWDDKTKLAGDNSGITVSIDYPISLSTTTDANGKFSFSGLPFDKYDISISKTGYGTYRIFSFGHNYNPNTIETVNTIPVINFAKSASTTISKLQLSTTSFNGVAGLVFCNSQSGSNHFEPCVFQIFSKYQSNGIEHQLYGIYSCDR